MNLLLDLMAAAWVIPIVLAVMTLPLVWVWHLGRAFQGGQCVCWLCSPSYSRYGFREYDSDGEDGE